MPTSSVEISSGPTKAMGNIMLNPVLLHIPNDGIYTKSWSNVLMADNTIADNHI